VNRETERIIKDINEKEVIGEWRWVEFSGVVREVIELEGEGSVCTTHQTVYIRKRTGVQGEKTKIRLGCYSASSQDPACQRSSKVMPPSPETSLELTWCAKITQEG